MQRREFLRTVAAGSVATTAAVASTFPGRAIAQGKMEWRMFSVWPEGHDNSFQLPLFAKIVAEASDGRLTINIEYGIPPNAALSSVSGETVEMGCGAPGFWSQRVPAADFLMSLPFGLTTQEQNAWFEYGGGQELADKVYAKLGCKFFPIGNPGLQMGGWFNKEINSIDDLKGLKIRMGVNLARAVMISVGAHAVWLPLGGTLQGLKTGTIDAAELIAPAADLAAGMHKAAKFYYYPGWHEPSCAFDLFINKAKWDALPGSLKAVIEGAARCANYSTLNRSVARNGSALATLVNEHGVQLRQFPATVLKELASKSEEVVRSKASMDKLSEEVLNSIMEFKKTASSWSSVSLAPYLAARA